MGNQHRNVWAAEFEAVRRQHAGRRGPGRAGPWGGPMGGPPPWVTQMFGPSWGAGPGGRGGRRTQARRGDVRAAILDVLGASAEPINGYQVIQQISERSDGVWKPSPGSVYPTIAQLEDEGLVEDAPTGRKALQLTAEGRTYVEEHAAEMERLWEPFAREAEDTESVNFKQVIGQTVGAIVQVASTGTADQRQKALEILDETRRQMYGLLAEGPDDTDEES